ncbi:MAG: hypothetical protein V7K98_17870 [Nostoc sp.]|uniref:hypothetical protein n=1 Tax=Nostoc sp. TaxID=1180 RepID=UPI002FFCA381
MGILPALKYKGRARCPSHKNSKIIPQICNAELFPNAQCPMPNSQFPNAQFPMPNAQIKLCPVKKILSAQNLPSLFLEG